MLLLKGADLDGQNCTALVGLRFWLRFWMANILNNLPLLLSSKVFSAIFLAVFRYSFKALDEISFLSKGTSVSGVKFARRECGRSKIGG